MPNIIIQTKDPMSLFKLKIKLGFGNLQLRQTSIGVSTDFNFDVFNL